MPSPDRVALAHERLAARARRIRLIRQRVVAGTLAAFVLAWGVVVFDGSMGEPTSPRTATTTSTPRPRHDDGDATDSDDSPSSDDDSSSSDDSAATMTTSQS